MIPIMKTMVMMLVINYFGGVDGNVAGSDCWFLQTVDQPTRRVLPGERLDGRHLHRPHQPHPSHGARKARQQSAEAR